MIVMMIKKSRLTDSNNSICLGHINYTDTLKYKYPKIIQEQSLVVDDEHINYIFN